MEDSKTYLGFNRITLFIFYKEFICQFKTQFTTLSFPHIMFLWFPNDSFQGFLVLCFISYF